MTVYVALVNASAPNEYAWANAFCAGALVSPTEVVTASHCIDADTLPDVYVGARDLCSAAVSARTHVTAATVGVGKARGLTLLHLEAPLEGAIGPSNGVVSVTPPVVAVGWGRLSTLTPRPCVAKHVSLVPAADGACDAVLRAAWAQGLVPPSVECLVPALGMRINTCQGDSGGGVYSIDSRGSVVLRAITLGGAGCDIDVPGVYAGPQAIAAMIAQTRGP